MTLPLIYESFPVPVNEDLKAETAEKRPEALKNVRCADHMHLHAGGRGREELPLLGQLANDSVERNSDHQDVDAQDSEFGNCRTELECIEQRQEIE